MNRSQVILITGARKGIGAHLTRHYLEKGLKVIGCSRQDSEMENRNYQHFCLDVSDESSVKKLFTNIRKEYGHLDFLINNAGVARMNHALLTPTASVREMLDTNFIGTFLFCREAAKLMIKNEDGRIVNVASIAVPLKIEGEAAYASSKAAVITFTQILARELGRFNVTVNAVGPGVTRTDLLKGVSDSKIEQVLARQAISRFTTFSDVANVIDFFLSRHSDQVTGQAIFLGGV